MKKIASLLAVAVAAFALSACHTVVPVSATTNPIAKEGKSSANFLFNMIPIPLSDGDYSIETAAKNGGITKVATIDHEENNILNLWVTKTTIVTGE